MLMFFMKNFEANIDDKTWIDMQKNILLDPTALVNKIINMK